MQRFIVLTLAIAVTATLVSCRNSAPSPPLQPTSTISQSNVPLAVTADDLLNRTNEAMSRAPGFHFSVTQHYKANKNDLNDTMTIQTEGDGKPGGDLLQYATMTGAQFGSQSIKIETRIVNNQAYNLNPMTNLWDVVLGSPYPPSEPVMMLLKGQLTLQGTQLVATDETDTSVYCIEGLPKSDFDMTSFRLWIDTSTYLTTKIKSTGSVSIPQAPSGTEAVVLEQWEFKPLKEAFIVNLPEGVTPPAAPVAKDIISTDFGNMILYRGERIPISVQIPADWVVTPDSSPHSYPLTMKHSNTTASQLTITEPTFTELGLSNMSLDAYANDVISVNKGNFSDLTLISESYINFSVNEKAKVVVFSVESGNRIFYRLIYIYKNNLVLNFTYAYRPSMEDIRPLIDYSFGTLQLVQ
jgi:hypothetical protein